MTDNSKDTFLPKCLRAGVCILGLVVLVVTANKTEDKKPDEDSRIIRVEKSEKNGYESAAYQCINETEGELVKTFYEEPTEDGVSVRIVSFSDGEEKVLMDCRYDTGSFPYYFERCSDYNKNIFYEFYTDQPVWEKTIRAENSNETYTLYYAQEIPYDEEDMETAGYEGHLWVTDGNTKIVKRLSWKSDAPYKKIAWKKSMLVIQYADGSERTCGLSEILRDPAETVCEKCLQIDFDVKEHPMDSEKNDAMTDLRYKNAYYRAISGQDKVRTSEGEEVYLKEYWYFQGDPLMEDEIFLKNLIENTQFYYMDFDGDGLPELVVDIIGDGLHILKYLPDEEIVELFFGYERMPYYHLLGSGQLYYKNYMVANKGMWRYDIVDADGQDSQIVFFMEDADYKPHKADEDYWWDMSYWVYLDEELGMVQVDEKQYQKITEKFFDALERAVPSMTFKEIFGRSVSIAPPQPSSQTQPQEQAWNINSPVNRIRLCCG